MMSEKGKKIIKNLNGVLPKLTNEEIERLLCYSEGVATVADRRQEQREEIA